MTPVLAEPQEGSFVTFSGIKRILLGRAPVGRPPPLASARHRVRHPDHVV